MTGLSKSDVDDSSTHKKSPAMSKAFYPANLSAINTIVAAIAEAGAGIRTGAAGGGHAFARLPLWRRFCFLGFFLGQLERERFHSILIFHFRIFLKIAKFNPTVDRL
ncbi:MAG TPA: hypothetical protein VF800_11380 [Telluria sp.]|jgi:hypothetical protein